MRRSRRRLCERIWRKHVERELARLINLSIDLARKGLVEDSRLVVSQALELSKSTRVRMPIHMKRLICKNCLAPLIPGVTARVRLRSQGRFSYTVVSCRLCGWIRRIPYKR